MSVRLIIENREVELDESVQFAITKEFEELSNPTVIINDWSKTVSIPFTQSNNELFGHLYSIDRVILCVCTSTTTTGIYFNPLKKLDFRLEWNNAVVMVGYAKLQQIKQVSGKGTYEFTLFGQLGKLFQIMKKITFDTTYEDIDYIIDGSRYVDTYISKELVSESWNSYGQYTSLLKKKNEDGYHITDIIGFAPNNSFNEGFDYKTFQVNQGSSETFQKVLETADFQTNSGVAPETAIPNGLLPREIGEYRSYLQLPYVYWNKLFKMFQEKAEALTGYTFDLDEDWFNTSNPYWYKLVYMLKDFFSDGVSDDNNFTNIYSWWLPGSGYIYWGSAAYNQTKSTVVGASIVREDLPILEISPLSPTGYDYDMDDYSGRVQSTLPFSLRFQTYQEYYKNVQLNPSNGFVFTVRIYDSDTSTGLSEATYLICRSNTTIDKSTYQNVIEYDGNSLGYNESQLIDKFDFAVPLNMFIPRGHRVRFEIRGRFVNTNMPFTRPGSQMWLPTVNLYLRGNANTINLTKEVRSNSHFTFNDLWNNDYNVFEEILKYCKTYRIVIYTDDVNKKVVFTPLYKYFQNITVSDWTDKIDKSKDFNFNIAPITFGKKYVLFNYKYSSTKLGKQYKEKYGYNYGEYRLTTDYNFDEDVDKLFKDVNGGMVTTDNVLSWDNLYSYKKVVFSFPSEIYVYCKDKDNKFVDVFGQFYFHNGLREFSTEEALHMRNVYISDDSDFMNGNNLYFYYQNSSASSRALTYPALDVLCGENMCLFNVPKENYTYLKNYSGKKSIYTNFWKKYIDERYNIQNKVINCYLELKPIDFINFKFNNLVKYGNQLCIVNKIYDYDITSDKTTKVDLITIQDIGGYNQSDYTYDYIIASTNSLTIPYDYYKKITIKSSGNWELHADDWGDYLTVSPTSGTAGETEVIIGSTDETHGYTLTFDLLNADDEIIGSEHVECNVGGTSTISIDGDWYTEYVIGGRLVSRHVTSDTKWKLIEVDNSSGVNIVYIPQPGVYMPSGSGVISYSCARSENTGVVDFWVENAAGDIASIRVNFIR